MKFVLKLFIPLLVVSVLLFLFAFLSKPKPSSVPVLTRPVVSVINPIRGSQLGLEQINLLKSLKSQWQVTKETNTSATWLWQYSAMEDDTLVNFAKTEMKDQEFGIFLEIDRNSSAKSGVLYRGNGPWYFSDGLFLLSYDQGERKKIIDTVFAKFKHTFGYYPKTVGAWWVGADNLQYMKEKYGIVASLQVADQYDLDVYSVWGQPWSIPYVASKDNAAVPAASFDKSLGVVIMQWAPRDPTYGYGNTFEHSTYSMQDYFLKNYDMSYVDYLFSVFLKGPGDQVVVGLESGLPADSYAGDYKEKLVKIGKLQKEQKISIQTAGDFADSFLSRKEVFGENSYFLSKGYKSDDQSFWYQSGKFRAGIEKIGNEVFLVDVRDYVNANKEDFVILPNSQGYLRVAAPAVIDSARTDYEKVLIGKTNNQLRVQKENDEIIITDGDKQLASFKENELVVAGRTFVMQEHKRQLNVFILLFSLLLLYTLVLLLVQKDKKNIYWHAGILFLCLLIDRPFLHSGNFLQSTYLFDPKFVFALPLLRFVPFDVSLEMLLFFQILPFLLLLGMHFFFIVKKQLLIVYTLGVFLFLFLYSHVPSMIVTEFITRKKIAGIGILGVYVLFALVVCCILFYKKKIKRLRTTLLLLFAGFLLVVSSVFLSWQKFVITPFEMKSLQVISHSQKNVYFIMPKQNPSYRAVEPLLLVDYRYGENLTNTKWQSVVRPEGKFLTFQDLDNHVIFVARYLGAELYHEEIKKYNLKKIFDNTQIQIYTH